MGVDPRKGMGRMAGVSCGLAQRFRGFRVEAPEIVCYACPHCLSSRSFVFELQTAGSGWGWEEVRMEGQIM